MIPSFTKHSKSLLRSLDNLNKPPILNAAPRTKISATLLLSFLYYALVLIIIYRQLPLVF